MNSQLFIPEKIKVGYQHRNDTYTKKLAYVIYYDKKGVLRKEGSWRSWIHDKPRKEQIWENGKWVYADLDALPIDDFENTPMEGFVLNKGVGGVSYGWDGRKAKIRVYDPRDFEIEITIENILFILAHCNAYKGKGLEGKFVYAWDGKELVLLPEGCPDFQACLNFTELQGGKIGSKDLEPGVTYITKQEKKLIYLGKFSYLVHYSYGGRDDKSVKYNLNYIFIDEPNKFIVSMSSLTSLSRKVEDSNADNYNELLQIYTKSNEGSPIRNIELVPVDIENIIKIEHYKHNRIDYISGNYLLEEKPNEYRIFTLEAEYDSNGSGGYYYNRSYDKLLNVLFTSNKVVSFSDNVPKIKSSKYDDTRIYQSKLKELKFFKAEITTESNRKYQLNF